MMPQSPSSFLHPETGELLSTQEEFRAALSTLEERLSLIYRVRSPIREEYAERFKAAEQPAPKYRTPTQEKVTRCPRCGGRLESEEAAE